MTEEKNLGELAGMRRAVPEIPARVLSSDCQGISPGLICAGKSHCEYNLDQIAINLLDGKYSRSANVTEKENRSHSKGAWEKQTCFWKGRGVRAHIFCSVTCAFHARAQWAGLGWGGVRSGLLSVQSPVVHP